MSFNFFSQNCFPLIFDQDTKSGITSSIRILVDSSPAISSVHLGSRREQESFVRRHFSYSINNFIIGKRYRLVFFQAHSEINPNLSSVERVPALWRIAFTPANLSNTPANSVVMESPLIKQSNTKVWERVEFLFIPTRASIDVNFTAIQPGLGLNGVDVDRRDPIEIRNIILFEEEQDCQINICDSYGSFNPTKNKKYVLSAWAKEESDSALDSYQGPNISILSNSTTSILTNAKPKGRIIDGWQKIEEDFFLSGSVFNLKFILANTGNNNVYFDDIRIHPFDGNMKSFVYDPVSQRLKAELDENNYATFYEYDNEGGLIRVKKETERGIQTIQETRSSSFLKEN